MKAPIVALSLTLNLKVAKFQAVKNKRDKRFLYYVFYIPTLLNPIPMRLRESVCVGKVTLNFSTIK